MGYATERHRAAIEVAGRLCPPAPPELLAVPARGRGRACRSSDLREPKISFAPRAASEARPATDRRAPPCGGADSKTRGSSVRRQGSVQLGLDRLQQILEQLGAGLLVELAGEHACVPLRWRHRRRSSAPRRPPRARPGRSSARQARCGARHIPRSSCARPRPAPRPRAWRRRRSRPASFSASLRFFWYSPSSWCASSRRRRASSSSLRILAARSSSDLPIMPGTLK